MAWFYAPGGVIENSSAIANGVVHLSAADVGVVALDLASGSVLWTTPVSSIGESSPAVANRVVYTETADTHQFIAIDAADGTIL